MKIQKIHDDEILLVNYPRYDLENERRIVSMLASVLGDAIFQYRVIQQYGKVFIVQFTIRPNHDLILPFVFTNRDRTEKTVLRSCYFTVSSMIAESRIFDYIECENSVKRIVNIVSKDYIDNEELLFFSESLYYAIAHPVASINPINWTGE